MSTISKRSNVEYRHSGTRSMEVLVYGAGGHGVVIANIVEVEARYKVVGFIDDNPGLWEIERYGYKVLGGNRLLSIDDFAGYPIVIGIGDNHTRKQIAVQLSEAGRVFAYAIIHPSSYIARDARIGLGTVIMANAVINPGTQVGEHVIVNTSATIDHDCVIEDFAHISPGAVLAGNVLVEEGAHVGMGSSILPGIKIGAEATIGAGSVVTKNIPAGATAVGVPARCIRD
jgi:sugar O-acyltransferase (sialic acid O-acetyltransferase NeuD family)